MRNGLALTLSLAVVVSCNGSPCIGDAGPRSTEPPASFPVLVPGRAAEPLVYTPDAVPPPTPSNARVTGLALAGSDLYFVDSVEGVFRAGMRDGSPVKLTTLDRPVALPTVASKGLYFVGDDDLVSVPKRVGGPLSVIRDRLVNPRGVGWSLPFWRMVEDYPWHLTFDHRHIYTAVQTGTDVGLYRVQKRDGASQRLANIKTMPASVAVGDGAIHFVAESDQLNVGTLWRLDLRTARLTTVATGLAASCCVVADGGHLAWAGGRDVFWMKHSENEVHRVVGR